MTLTRTCYCTAALYYGVGYNAMPHTIDSDFHVSLPGIHLRSGAVRAVAAQPWQHSSTRAHAYGLTDVDVSRPCTCKACLCFVIRHAYALWTWLSYFIIQQFGGALSAAAWPFARPVALLVHHSTTMKPKQLCVYGVHPPISPSTFSARFAIQHCGCGFVKPAATVVARAVALPPACVFDKVLYI